MWKVGVQRYRGEHARKKKLIALMQLDCGISTRVHVGLNIGHDVLFGYHGSGPLENLVSDSIGDAWTDMFPAPIFTNLHVEDDGPVVSEASDVLCPRFLSSFFFVLWGSRLNLMARDEQGSLVV